MAELDENFIDESPIDLPELTPKQNAFVEYIGIHNFSAIDAYREAFNTSARTATCYVEASRLLKNPKITLWLNHIKKTQKEYIENEIKYTINDAFKEFEELKIIALESVDQYGRPNVSAANKAVEMKCKLKGLMSDEAQVNNNVVVQMGEVEVNGNTLELMIGEDIAGQNEKEADCNLQDTCDIESTEEDSTSYLQSE